MRRNETWRTEMTRPKLRGLKWKIVNLREWVLHFDLFFLLATISLSKSWVNQMGQGIYSWWPIMEWSEAEAEAASVLRLGYCTAIVLNNWDLKLKKTTLNLNLWIKKNLKVRMGKKICEENELIALGAIPQQLHPNLIRI